MQRRKKGKCLIMTPISSRESERNVVPEDMEARKMTEEEGEREREH